VGYQIKENEVGGAYGMCSWEETCTRSSWGTRK